MTKKQEEPRDADLRRKAFDAVRRDDVPALELLFRSGIKVNRLDENRNTLLMVATSCGNLGVARFLLERGADTERRNRRDQTPIANAAYKGHLEMVKLLLSYGADPLAYSGGRLPVDFAALCGHTKVVRYLQSVAGAEKSPWRPMVAGVIATLRSMFSVVRWRGFYFVAGA